MILSNELILMQNLRLVSLFLFDHQIMLDLKIFGLPEPGPDLLELCRDISIVFFETYNFLCIEIKVIETGSRQGVGFALGGKSVGDIWWVSGHEGF